MVIFGRTWKLRTISAGILVVFGPNVHGFTDGIYPGYCVRDFGINLDSISGVLMRNAG